MKQLFVIRHAKSTWKEENLPDMDRPLKGRGIRDAYNSSQWLRQENYWPDYVISSPATRALHTALIFAKSLDYAYADIRIEGQLYLCSAQEMHEVVQALDDRYEKVFLFAHNPTITNYVNQRIDHRIDNVPTTGVACLQFKSKSWSQLEDSAELMFFDYPKRRKSK